MHPTEHEGASLPNGGQRVSCMQGNSSKAAFVVKTHMRKATSEKERQAGAKKDKGTAEAEEAKKEQQRKEEIQAKAKARPNKKR